MKFVIIIFLGWSLVACTADQTEKQQYEKKIADLEQQQKADSALMRNLENQLAEINQVFDSIAAYNQELKKSGGVKRLSVIARIRALDSLLKEKNKALERAQIRGEASGATLSQSAMVRGNVEQAKNQILVQSTYLNQLKTDLEKMRSENIDLKKIIEEKEKQLVEKDGIIQKITAERERQEALLTEINQKLAQADQQIKDATDRATQANTDAENAKKEAILQKAKTFYEAGKVFKEEFEKIDNKTIEIGTGKTKKELISQAYDYFQKAYQLGFADAKREMLILETEKKYSKHLKN